MWRFLVWDRLDHLVYYGRFRGRSRPSPSKMQAALARHTTGAGCRLEIFYVPS